MPTRSGQLAAWALVLLAHLGSAQLCAVPTLRGNYTAFDGSYMDSFGSSLAIATDGKLVAIGARFRDAGGTSNVGALYIFSRLVTATALNATRVTTFVPERSAARLGTSLAANADLSLMLSGGNSEDSYTGAVRWIVRFTATNYTVTYKLPLEDADNNFEAGFGLACTRDMVTCAVGAPVADSGDVSSVGTVWIHNRPPGQAVPAQVATVTIPVAETQASFGAAMAFTADGLVLVVGSPFFLSSAIPRAHVYVRQQNMQSWAFLRTITVPAVIAWDAFGAAVHISGDGLTLLIGATESDQNRGTVGRGSLHVFARPALGAPWEWSYRGAFSPSWLASGDGFGNAAVIADDGSGLLVGASNRLVSGTFKAGAVYDFVLPDCWRTAVTFSPGACTAIAAISDPARAAPGWSVRTTMTAGTAARNGARFGSSVSAAVSGAVLAVGAPGAFNTGAVHMFLRTEGPGAGQYAMLGNFSAPDLAAGDGFGRAVALSANASLLYIGTQQAASGPVAGAGAVRIFRRVGGLGSVSYTQIGTLRTGTPAASEAFGAALALSANDSLLVVGAPCTTVGAFPCAGSVSIYNVRTGGAALGLAGRILNPRPAVNAEFGAAVALSGNMLAVGAPASVTSAAGTVYVFTAAAGPASFTLIWTLSAEAKTAGGAFGGALALFGTTLLVGERQAAVNGASQAGIVRAFSASNGPAWQFREVGSLSLSSPSAGDNGGSSLAITEEGTLALVGVRGLFNQGAVAVLSIPPCWTLPSPSPTFSATRTTSGTASTAPSGSSSPSATPLRSTTPPPSRSGAASPSGAASTSAAASASSTSSISASAPASVSPGSTPTRLLSASSTFSAAPSPSTAPSASGTLSAVASPSTMPSPSASLSAKASPTASLSAAATTSPQPTVSGASSRSALLSASGSPSPSASWPSLSAKASPTASASGAATRSAERTHSSVPSGSSTATTSASPWGTGSSSPSPAATRSGAASHSAAPSSSAASTYSGSVSGTVSASATEAASLSPSPSATYVPEPVVTSLALELVQPACERLAGCSALPAVLRVSGSALLHLCVAGADSAFLTSWTSARLLQVRRCDEDGITAEFDFLGAPGDLFYGSRCLIAPPRGPRGAVTLGCTEPLPPPLAAVYGTAASWGSSVRLQATGVGAVGVAAVTLAGGVNATGGVPCAALQTLDDDTLACSLRFVRSAWKGRALGITLQLRSGALRPFLPREPLVLAPLAPLQVDVPLLARAGGTPVVFTLPHPAWTEQEAAAVGESAQLVMRVGGAASGPCSADASRTVVTCSAPSGAGPLQPALLAMGGSFVFPVAGLSYEPPLPVSVPQPILLLPSDAEHAVNVTLTITFDTRLGLDALVANVTVVDVPCAPAALLPPPAPAIVNCSLGAAGAVAAAFPDRDTVPLTVGFGWGGVAFRRSLGTLVLRPTLSSVAPRMVTPGGALIIFGAGFCPGDDCSAPTAGISVTVGSRECSGVALVSPTVATCTVPGVSADDPEFPSYTVRVRNTAGAVAREQSSVDFPSSAFVRPMAPLPTSFIPSDMAEPFPLEKGISVAIVPRLQTRPFAGEIDCSLISQTQGVFVSAVTTRNLTQVDFGRIAVQAPFSLASVTLAVSCTSVSADFRDTLPLVWSLALVPLRVALCGKPAAEVRSQARMPPIVLKLAAGTSNNTAVCAEDETWSDPPLPPISCSITFTAPAGEASLQNSVERMNGNATAAFERVSLSGEVDRGYTLGAACSIGAAVRVPPAHTWTVRVTGCNAGSQPVGVLCVGCASGFYSDGGEAACRSCPRYASCDGGILQLPAGIFRPPGEEGQPLDGGSELHTCALPAGCSVDPVSRTFGCNEGYGGPLCGVCNAEEGWAKFDNQCLPCLDQRFNTFILVLASLVSVAGLSIFVLRKSRSAGSASASSGIATSWRILLSYMQALSSLRGFRSNGGALFRRALGFASIFSVTALSEGPAQCVARPSFGAVFAVTLCLPLLALVLATIVMLVADAVAVARTSAAAAKPEAAGGAAGSEAVAAPASAPVRPPASPVREFLQRTRQNLLEGRHIAILMVTLHLCYMPITSAAINVFKCSEPIGGVRYLSSDLRQPCEGEVYAGFAATAVLVLLFFGVGFPAVVAWRLTRAPAAALSNPSFRAKWGFLADGYKAGVKGAVVGAALPLPAFGRPAARAHQRSFLGWEAVVLSRKAVIIGISSLLNNADPNAQIAAVIMVLLLFAMAHARFLPYASRQHNVTEGASLIVVIFSAALCLLSPADSAGSGGSAIAVSVVLILLNLITVAVLLGELLRGIVRALRTSRSQALLSGASKVPEGGAAMSAGVTPGGDGAGSRGYSAGAGSRGGAPQSSVASVLGSPLAPIGAAAIMDDWDPRGTRGRLRQHVRWVTNPLGTSSISSAPAVPAPPSVPSAHGAGSAAGAPGPLPAAVANPMLAAALSPLLQSDVATEAPVAPAAPVPPPSWSPALEAGPSPAPEPAPTPSPAAAPLSFAPVT